MEERVKHDDIKSMEEKHLLLHQFIFTSMIHAAINVILNFEQSSKQAVFVLFNDETSLYTKIWLKVRLFTNHSID